MRIIACEMMENEIKKAMHDTSTEVPVIWLERGLHNSPDKLRKALQERIDSMPVDETALLAFSQCGNATLDLKCSCSKIVIPRFADCIRITLSQQHGEYNEADKYTLYSSKGWMDSNHSMREEYMQTLKKYGPEKTKRVYHEMLKAYCNFCLMDTGAYNVSEYTDKAKETAALFGLEYKTCCGYIRVYEKLFKGEWDDEFVVKSHGETVTINDFFDFLDDAPIQPM